MSLIDRLQGFAAAAKAVGDDALSATLDDAVHAIRLHENDYFWEYIKQLRNEISDLKAGVDYYDEVIRLRGEKIDLLERIEELERDG